MIIGLFHKGSGVGDQLFCYLAARVTAERLGVDFGMVGEFKGDSFLKIDKGIPVPFEHTVEMPAGKIVVDAPFPVYEGQFYYDPEFNFIQDNTIVDGCKVQDERYWEDYPIHEWLQTEPLKVPDDVCVIGFRGGEYYTDPRLGLPVTFYMEAIEDVLKINPQMKFEVHTDDVELAKQFFPKFNCVHNVGINWRAMRYAKNAIIANSAFYIIPRLLCGDTVFMRPMTIAPRYWARRNIKEWSTPQNFYKSFQYV